MATIKGGIELARITAIIAGLVGVGAVATAGFDPINGDTHAQATPGFEESMLNFEQIEALTLLSRQLGLRVTRTNVETINDAIRIIGELNRNTPEAIDAHLYNAFNGRNLNVDWLNQIIRESNEDYAEYDRNAPRPVNTPIGNVPIENQELLNFFDELMDNQANNLDNEAWWEEIEMSNMSPEYIEITKRVIADGQLLPTRRNVFNYIMDGIRRNLPQNINGNIVQAVNNIVAGVNIANLLPYIAGGNGVDGIFRDAEGNFNAGAPHLVGGAVVAGAVKAGMNTKALPPTPDPTNDPKADPTADPTAKTTPDTTATTQTSDIGIAGVTSSPINIKETYAPTMKLHKPTYINDINNDINDADEELLVLEEFILPHSDEYYNRANTLHAFNEMEEAFNLGSSNNTSIYKEYDDTLDNTVLGIKPKFKTGNSIFKTRKNGKMNLRTLETDMDKTSLRSTSIPITTKDINKLYSEVEHKINSSKILTNAIKEGQSIDQSQNIDQMNEDITPFSSNKGLFTNDSTLQGFTKTTINSNYKLENNYNEVHSQLRKPQIKVKNRIY